MLLFRLWRRRYFAQLLPFSNSMLQFRMPIGKLYNRNLLASYLG